MKRGNERICKIGDTKKACHRRDVQSNMSMTCGLNPMVPFNKGVIEEINHLFTSMLTPHHRWLILSHSAVQIHSQQKTALANCKRYAFIRKIYRNGMHQCFPATRSHNSFSTSWVNQKSPPRQVSDSYISFPALVLKDFRRRVPVVLYRPVPRREQRIWGPCGNLIQWKFKKQLPKGIIFKP